MVSKPNHFFQKHTGVWVLPDRDNFLCVENINFVMNCEVGDDKSLIWEKAVSKFLFFLRRESALTF